MSSKGQCLKQHEHQKKDSSTENDKKVFDRLKYIFKEQEENEAAMECDEKLCSMRSGQIQQTPVLEQVCEG